MNSEDEYNVTHEKWGFLKGAMQGIVSHRPDLSHEEKHELVLHIERCGCRLAGAIPDHTLLIVGSPEALDMASNHSHVVWTGEHQQHHKIAPEWNNIYGKAEDAHRLWESMGKGVNVSAIVLERLQNLLPEVHMTAPRQGPPLFAIQTIFPLAWIAPPQLHPEGHPHRQDMEYRRERILSESKEQSAGAAASAEWKLHLQKIFGLDVLLESGGPHSVLVFTPGDKLKSIVEWLAAQPVTHWVNPYPRFYLHNNQASSTIQAKRASPQGRNVNLDPEYHPFWTAGITGENIVLGCGDSGMDRSHCYFVDPNVDWESAITIQEGFRTFESESHRKIRLYRAYGDFGDHNGHGSHTTGTLAGSPYNQPLDGSAAEYIGMAPNAKVAFLDLSSSLQGDAISTPYDIAGDYFDITYNVGARIHSDSWGSTSLQYDFMSAQVDAFCWSHPDFLPFFPSGNERAMAGNDLGLLTVNSPATSKNCLAIGATQSAGEALVNAASSAYKATVTSSSKIPPKEFIVLQASFGGSMSTMMDRSLPIVVAEPLLGCSPILNDVAGAAVLIYRGDCYFSDKAAAAQAAGAEAVIIYDNEQRPFFAAQSAADASSGNGRISIPVVSTTRTLGQKLVNEISVGEKLSIRFGSASPAQEAFEDLAQYSSQGPTLDGRIKPDLVAPGTVTSAATGQPTQNTCSLSPLQMFARMAGTSMATPAAAGSAALVRQYFIDGYHPTGAAVPSNAIQPSGPLIKGVMLGGAQALQGYDSATGFPIEPPPSFRQGFGRVSLSTALPLVGRNGPRLSFVDQVPINTGESHSYCVRGNGGPLSVTLVWHDYPSSPSAARNLVNDLDLTVRALGLNGIKLLGNGGSSKNSAVPDTDNNVEQVSLDFLNAGQVAIEVRATSTYASAGPQPYSLVIIGAFSGDIKPPTGSATEDCAVVVASIQSGPKGATSVVPVAFELTTQSGTGVGVAFECKMTDSIGEVGAPGTHDWKECSTPAMYPVLPDGAYQFSVRAEGEEISTSQSFILDTAPPEIMLVDGLPTAVTSKEVAVVSFQAVDATEVSLQCRVQLTNGISQQQPVLSELVASKAITYNTWYNCSSPQALRWLLPGEWTFTVSGVDAAGNKGGEQSYSWSVAFEDGVQYARVLRGPYGRIAGGEQSYQMAVMEGDTENQAVEVSGVPIDCHVTKGSSTPSPSWQACNPTISFTPPEDGVYNFATRPSGSVRTETWASAVFEVDSQPPQVTMSETPSDVLTGSVASFRFTIDEEGSTATCGLTMPGQDASPELAPCTSPIRYENLTDGAYVFKLVATDAVGNVAEAIQIPFVVDSSPPVINKVDIPKATSAESVTATFEVSDGGGSGVQNVTCHFRPVSLARGQLNLNDPMYDWKICVSPVTFTSDGGLAEGRYQLALKAMDKGGHITTTPEYTVYIDRTPPVVQIESAPSSSQAVPSTAVTFVFGDAANVAEGSGSNVTWQVLAKSLAEQDWQEVRAGNNTALNSTDTPVLAEEKASNRGRLLLAVVSNSNQSSQLGLNNDDLNKWSNCTSPCTFKGLKSGYYSLLVKGVDDAGNSGSTAKPYTFQVDTSLDPSSGLPTWAFWTIIGGSVFIGILLLFFLVRCCLVRRRRRLEILPEAASNWGNGYTASPHGYSNGRNNYPGRQIIGPSPYGPTGPYHAEPIESQQMAYALATSRRQGAPEDPDVALRAAIAASMEEERRRKEEDELYKAIQESLRTQPYNDRNSYW